MSQEQGNTPAQRLSDESVRMLRDLFAKHAENGATIFHQAHAEELLALAEEVIAMRSETTLNNAAVAETPTEPCGVGSGERSPDAAPSHDKKHDAWRSAALRLGEQLAPTGPNWYYAMTPTQWLEWCQSALPSAVAHSDCPDCGGTGSTPISTCLRCGGTGSLQSATAASIDGHDLVAWLKLWWTAGEGWRQHQRKEYGPDVAHLMRGVADMIENDRLWKGPQP